MIDYTRNMNSIPSGFVRNVQILEHLLWNPEIDSLEFETFSVELENWSWSTNRWFIIYDVYFTDKMKTVSMVR